MEFPAIWYSLTVYRSKITPRERIDMCQAITRLHGIDSYWLCGSIHKLIVTWSRVSTGPVGSMLGLARLVFNFYIIPGHQTSK